MATHTEHENTRTLAPQVLGVVVSVGRTPYLPGVLRSIAEQEVAPHRVVLVDVSARADIEVLDVAVLNDAGIDVQIVHAPRARTFGSAVSTGLNSIDLHEQWLWLLHDDAIAHPGALAAQLKPVEHTSSLSIVGAKQRKLGEGKELINVGYSTSRAGTLFTGIESQEFDQGQHDSRDDVYAVSLNGALVSSAAWLELKGTEPAFGKYGDSLDFCRRARLAGHRIIIEAQAVVEHAQADYMNIREHEELTQTPRPTVLDEEPAARSFWARLTSSMLFGATNYSIFLFPFILIAAIVVAPLRMLYRLLTKAPRLAVQELLAPFWLAAKFPAVIRLRSKIVRTKKVSAEVLVPLMASTAEIRNARRNRRLARTALRKRLYGPSDLDRREFRALARKRIAVLGIVTFIMVAATLYALHDLMGAVTGDDRLVGGAMLPAQGGWPELWQHWSSGWIRDGLGASAPSDPLLATLAPVMVLTLGNMQLAANLVMIGALLASAMGAWFAAGAISRSVTARAWTALIWAAAPTMLFALEQGRMGAVIAHSALPWLALTVMRGLGLNKRDARGALRFRHEQRQEEQLVAAGVVAETPATQPRRSLAAIGGAALIFAVIVAAVPVLLLPGLIVFGLAGLFSRARALLFVPIPALAVLGPVLFRGFVNREVGGWRVLFADPGAAFAYEPSLPWQRLLGVPSAVMDVSLDSGLAQAVTAIQPYVLGGALLIGALVSLGRRGPRAGQIRLAWWIALLGLVTSLASSAIVVASGESGAITGWSGSGVSLMTLGLLAACLLASDEVAAAALTRSFGWRQVSLGLATLAVFVLPIGTLAVWGSDRDIAHESSSGAATPAANLKAIDRALVPAVAQQMQTSGRQARVLGIQPSGVGRISYQLMHGDGMQLMETSTVVDVAYLTGRPDDIAGLVAHLARGLEQEGHSASAYQLASMGIGAVLVPPGDSDEYAQLIARLDTVAGLQRITENETGTVWRVDPRVLEAERAYGEVSSVSARNAIAQERAASQAVESELGPDGSTPANPTADEGEGTTSGEGSSPIELETTTVVVAGEPAWATTYVRGEDGALRDPETLSAGRLAVRTRIEAGAERTIVLAENAAPGWSATLGGRTLTSAQVNGMQAFVIPEGEGGQLKIAYERSSRIAWLVLQSVVLVAFGALAIPVRRRGTQRWA